MPTPKFSVSDIRKFLSASSGSLLCGSNGNPPLLLNKGGFLNCVLLCDLFNTSLQQCCVFKAWKAAIILYQFIRVKDQL